MNKRDSRKIADTITTKQIQEMFDKARESISDWSVVSSVNKGMSKGTAWNILAKGFDPSEKLRSLAATNMVWEFGDYLDNDIKPKKQKRCSNIKLHHEEPIFDT